MATSKRKTSQKQHADRSARVAAMRAQETRSERRRKLFTYGGGGLAGAVAVTLVVILAMNQSGKTTSVDEVMPAPVSATSVVAQGKVTTIKSDSGIDGVVEYQTKGADSATADPPPGVVSHKHGTGRVNYSVTPPVGGEHNADGMTCGVYDKPVPSERAVHNLEHGAVWITYRPSLGAAQVSALQDFVRRQPNAKLTVQGATNDLRAKFLDLSPWADDSLPSAVVISSWGAQLRVDSPADPRLQQFVDKFRVRVDKTFEAGASCGVSSFGGGGTPLFS